MAAIPPVFSRPRTVVIFLVAAGILVLLVWQTIRVVQPILAQRYFERGIAYLKVQNFDNAEKEFRNSEVDGSPDAAQWLAWSQQAPTDPKVLESYWHEWGVDDVVRLLSEAEGSFTTPKEALTEGIKLYNAGESPYAQYAIDQALTLDPGYPEAWHYRYLTYQKIAELNANYRAKADAAKAMRDSLTSLYLNP